VGNFQDRLVSELRLARAKTKAEAQAVLDQFLVDYIRKFTKPAAQCEPAWRKASLTQIEQGLCFKDQRTVTKDNTVTFEGTVFQIAKKSPYRSYSNKRIDVHVLLDGAVEFFLPKEEIARFDSKNNARIWLISNEWQAGRVPLWTPLRGIRTNPMNCQPNIYYCYPDTLTWPRHSFKNGLRFRNEAKRGATDYGFSRSAA